MTAPGALPPRRSVYEAPTTAPQEMTATERAVFATATVAAVAQSSGEQKKSIANAAVLLLVPMLRALDPFNDDEVARFGAKAAELVETARQETAKVSWAAIQQYLSAYDINLGAEYQRVGPGRNTALEVAYQRVAKDYRRRVAAGVESIQKTIAQVEDERFQALGGAEVAAQRTGESNAEIEGQDRSLKASRQAERAPAARADRSDSSPSGTRERDGGPARTGTDREVNREPDDWDAEDAAARAERERQDAEDAAADAALDAAEEELRRQARLSDEEQEAMLRQVAQHEMEVRMERMVNDDVALASRQASQDAMLAAPKGRVTGYRRVVHPELTESGVSCGLCVVASTRVYRVGELLPIHNLCKCEVVPIVDGNDPGDQINKDDLDAFYLEAGGTTDGRELKRERYVVFDHPELGPVLRNAKHSMQPIGFSQREASEDHKLAVKKRADEYHRQRAENFGRTTK